MKRLCIGLAIGAALAMLVGALAEAAIPVPAGDLSFLSDYVDAVRVGDWYLACEAATGPEEPFDSATRNTTAPWVLLDEAGGVLAKELYWWPRDDAWPLQPRPFEGFEEGVDVAVVRVGQKYGLIDRTGKLVAEPVYDNLFGFEPGDATCPAEKDGRWGCIDAAGNVVVPMIYDESFSRFTDGRTVVCRDGLQGVLGEDGKELLPAAYDAVWLADGAPYGLARRGDVCGLFDREGRMVLERELGEGGWIYCYPGAEPPFVGYNSTDETYIFLNLDGTDALGGPYDYANGFWKGSDEASVSVGGRWGRLRRDGSFAIPPEYDWIGNPSEGLIPAQRDGLYGYLDENGNVAIPFQYADAGSFSGGYADACPRDDAEAHGLIDHTGRWVIAPMLCDQVDLGPDGVAVACEGSSLLAFYHFTGNVASPIDGLRFTYDVTEGRLPHENAGNLATLDGPATLKRRVSDEARLPHLDGEGRLYPLYAAYVEAVYPKDVRYDSWDHENNPVLTVSGEDTPWQRLLDGDADIIFVRAPEPEASVWATLAARRLAVDYIPLCRDALVFPVNAENPVEDLSTEQLRRVYAGEIVDWADVGGAGLGAIVAYQAGRDEDAQAAFDRLCGFDPLAEAPEGVVSFDGWVPEATIGPAGYRNLPNALGYALRSRCGSLTAGGAVRLLSVDGVAPTDENIESGAYPFAETLYAVTLKGNDNPNVRALLNWIQSEQGRELARKAGFAAISPKLK